MPKHRENTPAVLSVLERVGLFTEVVDGGHLDSAAESADALVVVAIADHFASHSAVQNRAAEDREPPQSVVLCRVLDVLDQVASEVHVEELEPPANTEDGQIGRQLIHQARVEIVAQVAFRTDFGSVELLAVVLGVDVSAAREDDTVDDAWSESPLSWLMSWL